MPSKNRFVRIFCATILAATVTAASAPAAEAALVSSTELMDAVMSSDGMRLAPAEGVSIPRYTEDYANPQVLEIIRPNQNAIAVGRIATSCSCLSATLTQKSFGPGERALVEVRNVKATPPQGATYAIFVQLTEPYKTTLQYNMFVKSERGADGAATAVPSASVMPAPSSAVPSIATAPTIAATPVMERPGVVKAPPFKYEDIEPYAPKSPAPQPEATGTGDDGEAIDPTLVDGSGEATAAAGE